MFPRMELRAVGGPANGIKIKIEEGTHTVGVPVQNFRGEFDIYKYKVRRVGSYIVLAQEDMPDDIIIDLLTDVPPIDIRMN